jgi:hypothetical protein
MNRREVAVICAAVLCLILPASAAMYTIENPAAKIINPADTMYNPATQIKNPASTIYNPAARMNNPDPLSPPTPVVAPPVAAEPKTVPRPAKRIVVQPQLRPEIPPKNYNFKSVTAYIQVAKKAFVSDNYAEFISITEDALRRIESGTLKSSKKTRQRLEKYRNFGYALLDKN